MVDPSGSGDEINNAAKNFSETSNKIDAALKYTDNDMELAKKMVSGDFQDVYIIKGKVRSDISREFGLFMILIQKVGLRVKNLLVSMCLSPYVFDTKLSISWEEFHNALKATKNDKEFDHNLTLRVEKYLNISVTTAEVAKLVQTIEAKNLQKVTDDIQGYFKNELKMTQCEIQVEIEQTNSIAIEEGGIDDKNISRIKQDQKLKVEEEDDELPENVRELIKSSIVGASVLSPTKGKEVPNLRLGDKIKVHITDTSQRGRNVLKILGAATEDGALKPVPATIRFMQKLKNGNWLIIASLGEDIYIKVEEETESVRIAVVETMIREKEVPKTNYGLIIGLIIGIIVLLAAILVFIFL